MSKQPGQTHLDWLKKSYEDGKLTKEDYERLSRDYKRLVNSSQIHFDSGKFVSQHFKKDVR